MPLGFHCLSHGAIAFGFFNIETDLLLMHQHVFWCRDFCVLVSDLAKTEPRKWFQARLNAWFLPSQADLGDLHGSIAGRTHYGLIGETYRLWPFPRDLADFHQKSVGAAAKKEVQEMVDRFGQPQELEVVADAENVVLSLGEYQFNPTGVRALADYVWRGGMPGWLGGERPDYLWEAASVWRQAVSPFVAGLPLDPKGVGYPAKK
jgi:hypothetical protein